MTQETNRGSDTRTMASPWSVKGVDSETRLMAKRAARRAGMTMGAWLSQVIKSAGEADLDTAAPGASDRLESMEERLARIEGRFDDTVTPLSRAVVKLAERVQQISDMAPPDALASEQEMSPEEARQDPRFGWLYRTLSQEKQD